jgi:hypothetical protein
MEEVELLRFRLRLLDGDVIPSDSDVLVVCHGDSWTNMLRFRLTERPRKVGGNFHHDRSRRDQNFLGLAHNLFLPTFPARAIMHCFYTMRAPSSCAAYCFIGTLSSRRFAMSSSSSLSSSCNLLNETLERLRQDKQETLLLDGGTGEELFRRGVPDDRKIWSATALVHSQYHEILKDVHKSFITAGARAITTNSYGVIPGVGFSTDEIRKYVRTAGRLARESVREGNSEQQVLVLGSLGPLVESYRPDKILPHDEGVEIYRAMVESLSDFCDCFLAETMSSYQESIQAVDAVKSQDMPLMVSFTLNGKGELRSGESVVSGLGRLLDYTGRQGGKRTYHQVLQLLCF